MRWLYLALVVAVFATIAVAEVAPCYQPGQRVLLRSTLDDPRVLLWRKRSALDDYMNGKGGAYSVELGTLLIEPDAEAVVVQPCPDGNERLLGVKVMGGQHKGEYGWVDARDAATLR